MRSTRLCSFILLTTLGAPASLRAQAVETEIAGVTAEIVELRAADGALRLLVRLNNTSTTAAETSRFAAQRIALVDAKTKRKYLPTKDADGLTTAGPLGDRLDNGRILAAVPPGASTIVWAYFEPLPAGTVVSVEVPQMFPFENVVVADAPSRMTAAKTAKSTPAGVTATIVSAKRADQILTVRLRLAPDKPGAHVSLGSPYFNYRDVFLLDPAGKRKYPLMKDTDGLFQAQPLTVKTEGGSFLPEWGQTILMTLTFQAPPDSVTSFDLMLPKFLPFVAVPIEGTGGSAGGGLETSGRSLGLEGALKDLNARVTASDIIIDLSADVLFDFDKADLKKDAEAQLAKVATVIKANPSARVSIEGHTDAKGADAYNQSLSERRAASVKDWLVANGGVNGGSVTTRGWGRTKPVAPNTKPDGSDDPAGRQANRRVQIVVRKAA